MRNDIGRRTGTLAMVALFTLATVGCSSMSRGQKGVVIGAGAGGVIGAVIGDAAGSTARGAIIGAVVGGAAGALIASRMDDKAEVLAGELDGATVERFGEGILVTFESGILFDFDSSVLQSEARANLTDLARVLSDDLDDYELMVVGHTDAVGAEEYNQRLSERRAQAAVDFLTSIGIPAALTHGQGMGEMEPLASNETEEGRRQNRRVEVAIFASDDYRAEARRTTGD